MNTQELTEEERVKYISKWMKAMLWLIIPNMVATFAINAVNKDELGIFGIVGLMLFAIDIALDVFVTFKLAKVAVKFKYAAILCLVGNVFAMFAYFMDPTNDYTTLMSILSFLFFGASEYNEIIGYSDILHNVNIELSDNWRKIIKWYLVSLGVIAFGFFAYFFSGFLVLLGVLGGGVMVLIVSICRIILLGQTINYFSTKAEKAEKTELIEEVTEDNATEKEN